MDTPNRFLKRHPLLLLLGAFAAITLTSYMGAIQAMAARPRPMVTVYVPAGGCEEGVPYILFTPLHGDLRSFSNDERPVCVRLVEGVADTLHARCGDDYENAVLRVLGNPDDGRCSGVKMVASEEPTSSTPLPAAPSRLL